MGVLPCNRKGCENIMCDRYSSEFGYICYECFQELVDSGENPETFMGNKRESTEDFDYDQIFRFTNL